MPAKHLSILACSWTEKSPCSEECCFVFTAPTNTKHTKNYGSRPTKLPLPELQKARKPDKGVSNSNVLCKILNISRKRCEWSSELLFILRWVWFFFILFFYYIDVIWFVVLKWKNRCINHWYLPVSGVHLQEHSFKCLKMMNCFTTTKIRNAKLFCISLPTLYPYSLLGQIFIWHTSWTCYFYFSPRVILTQISIPIPYCLERKIPPLFISSKWLDKISHYDNE